MGVALFAVIAWMAAVVSSKASFSLEQVRHSLRAVLKFRQLRSHESLRLDSACVVIMVDYVLSFISAEDGVAF